jgi:hypothetical protein
MGCVVCIYMNLYISVGYHVGHRLSASALRVFPASAHCAWHKDWPRCVLVLDTTTCMCVDTTHVDLMIGCVRWCDTKTYVDLTQHII